MSIFIYDVLQQDDPGVYRGGGRVMQMLRENLDSPNNKVVTFTASLDIIGSNDTLLIPVWDPFQPPILSKRIAKKQILMIFDVIPLRHKEHFPVGIRGKLNMWKNKRALRQYDSFITISEHAKSEIKAVFGIPDNKIKVVYPTFGSFLTSSSNTKAAKDKAILAKHNVEPGKYCMYVGDVNWNKNVATLAKAVQMAKMPTLFVGKVFNQVSGIATEKHPHPWLREFKKFTSIIDTKASTNSSTDSYALFPGYVPDDELKVLYKHALCNILVSRDEGFGMSYLEAATQKCPSVLSDIPVFHEIAQDTALFANKNSHKKIAHAIDTLKKSPKIRTELGNAAFERSKHFAPAKFTVRMMDALQDS